MQLYNINAVAIEASQTNLYIPKEIVSGPIMIRAINSGLCISAPALGGQVKLVVP
jgi:hypothetical protein